MVVLAAPLVVVVVAASCVNKQSVSRRHDCIQYTYLYMFVTHIPIKKGTPNATQLKNNGMC